MPPRRRTPCPTIDVVQKAISENKQAKATVRRHLRFCPGGVENKKALENLGPRAYQAVLNASVQEIVAAGNKKIAVYAGKVVKGLEKKMTKFYERHPLAKDVSSVRRVSIPRAVNPMQPARAASRRPATTIRARVPSR